MTVLTLEIAIEKAKFYKTKKLFIHNCRPLYIKALKKNWMPVLDQYLEDSQHKLKNHSFEECRKQALLYNTLTDFHSNCPSYWLVANRKGWINSICSHMANNQIKNNKTKKLVKDVSGYKIGGFWTLDRVKKEIVKNNFKTKRDIALSNRSLYEAIIRNKWQDLISIEWSSKRHIKYSKEFCAETAKKYNTISSFQSGDRNVYWAASNKGWLNDICSHMEKNELQSKAGSAQRSSNWTDEELLNEFKKYSKSSDVQKYSRNQYFAAYRRGPDFFAKCKVHFLHTLKTPKYSDDFLRTRALAHSERYAFYKAETNIYQAIIKRKLYHFLDHMPKSSKAVRSELLDSHPEFMEMLSRLNLDEIQYEKALDGSIPDFTLFKNNNVLVVEIKCDKQNWSIPQLEEQIERYDKVFRSYYKEKLVHKPILTSKSGKYGISFKEAIKLIKKILD